MKTSMRLILAAAAALFTFASCASKDAGPMPEPQPVDDGGVYSEK